MLSNHGEVAVRSTDGIPATRPVSGTGVLAVTVAGIEHVSWSGSVVSIAPGGAVPFSNSTPLTGLGASGRAPFEPAPPFAPHQLARASIDNGSLGEEHPDPIAVAVDAIVCYPH